MLMGTTNPDYIMEERQKLSSARDLKLRITDSLVPLAWAPCSSTWGCSRWLISTP